ncbi:hypothetical protein [Spiroplasma sp. SV19]|uniref:hypothetical protein n=1 Tax=Spiroplasma sp. SV19 TaxID=2570468 RepID=UPI0024B72A08|nr:hypothetical protein [Spiroplasma sp. SV19]WHQ36771.1 hypothetical protein E7Y35_02545 [Spiroplasma sp. SV19]
MKKIFKKIWVYSLNITYNLTAGIITKIFVPKIDAKIQGWLYKAFDWLDNGKLDNSFQNEEKE